MKLLIDSGNTRVKLGWLTGNGEREPRPIAFEHVEVEHALPVWLAALDQPPKAAIGVNVAGTRAAQVIEHALQAAGCRTEWQMAGVRMLGLVNGYRLPKQLGADRWFAMLGLWTHPRHRPQATGLVKSNGAQAPAQVLASFGTATTVDTISPDGVFTGGLILPGPRLMLDSLARGTANLPLAVGEPMPFPDNTDQAIASGVMAAQAGAVIRQLLAAREKFPGHALRLALAGGASPDVASELVYGLRQAGLNLTPWIMDNPVLDGLAMLATAQTAKPSN